MKNQLIADYIYVISILDIPNKIMTGQQNEFRLFIIYSKDTLFYP